MIVAAHIVVGAAIGSVTKDPVLAVAGGLGSHYLMDLIPHTNYLMKNRNRWQEWFKLAAEPIISILLFTTLGLILQIPYFIWLGMLSAALPDIVSSLHFLSRKLNKELKFLRFHTRIHERWHIHAPWRETYHSFSAIVLGSLYLLLLSN